VRTYSPGDIDLVARRELERTCAALRDGPLGSRCRFALLSSTARGADEPLRLGTYGQIRGARVFLAGAVRRGPCDLEDYGYLFECLVLKAWDLGLGTCWLGGIFSRGEFARGLGLGEGELLPAVSPVGPAAGGLHLVDSVIRFGARSSRRRAWSELFFDGSWEHPLAEDGAGALAGCLEAVRRGPSASNRQPWRLLREGPGGPVHLFLRRSPGYLRLAPVDLQRADMGIAMAHFELAAREAGLRGSWAVEQPPVGSAAGQALYVATWRDRGDG
jgi:nitroreductase